MVCYTFFRGKHGISEKADSFLPVQTSLISGPQAGFHFSLWETESHVEWEGLETVSQILTWTWVDSPPPPPH